MGKISQEARADDPYANEEEFDGMDGFIMIPMGMMQQGQGMGGVLMLETVEEIRDEAGTFYQKKITREGPGFKEVTIVSGGNGEPHPDFF